MKLAKISASHEFILQMMIQGWNAQFAECESGLPEGTELVYSYTSDSRQTVYFVVSHESFEDIKLGDDIPELRPQFRKWYSPEAEAELMKLKAGLSHQSPIS